MAITTITTTIDWGDKCGRKDEVVQPSSVGLEEG
jgi:hypothetical protein